MSGFGRFLNDGPDVPQKIVISQPSLDEHSLMVALTFWDKVIWPVMDIVPFGDFARPNEFQKALINAGQLEIYAMPVPWLEMSRVNFFEGRFLSEGPQNQQILMTYKKLMTEIPKFTKSSWTFSSELDQFGRAVFRSFTPGLAFDLVDCIPMVTKVKSVDHFARWREDRKVERRRFMLSIAKLAADIQISETPDTLLNARLEEIREIARAVVETGQEKGLSFELGSRRFNFNLRNLEFKDSLERFAYAAGIPVFADYLTSGIIAGSTAALQPAFSIKKSFGLRNINTDLAPFLSVGKFLYHGAKG